MNEMNEMNEMDEMNEAIVMRYVDTANEVHEINEIRVSSQVLRGVVNICDTVVFPSQKMPRCPRRKWSGSFAKRSCCLALEGSRDRKALRSSSSGNVVIFPFRHLLVCLKEFLRHFSLSTSSGVTFHLSSSIFM